MSKNCGFCQYVSNSFCRRIQCGVLVWNKANYVIVQRKSPNSNIIQFCFILCGTPLLIVKSKAVLVEKRGNLHVLLALFRRNFRRQQILNNRKEDRNALFRPFFFYEKVRLLKLHGMFLFPDREQIPLTDIPSGEVS